MKRALEQRSGLGVSFNLEFRHAFIFSFCMRTCTGGTFETSLEQNIVDLDETELKEFSGAHPHLPGLRQSHVSLVHAFLMQPSLQDVATLLSPERFQTKRPVQWSVDGLKPYAALGHSL